MIIRVVQCYTSFKSGKCVKIMLNFRSIIEQCQVPTFGDGLLSSQCGTGDYLDDAETCQFTCDTGFTPLTEFEDTVTCTSGTTLTLPTCQGN